MARDNDGSANALEEVADKTVSKAKSKKSSSFLKTVGEGSKKVASISISFFKHLFLGEWLANRLAKTMLKTNSKDLKSYSSDNLEEKVEHLIEQKTMEIEHRRRKYSRVKNAVRVFWFLGMGLGITTVTLAILIAVGVLTTSVFAPLPLLGVFASWAASLWAAGYMLAPIFIAMGILVLTPIVLGLLGSVVGQIYHFICELPLIRQSIEYYKQHAFVRYMTNLGAILGVVTVGLGVMALLMSQLGMSIGGVAGVGLMTSLTGFLGANVLALVLASVISGTAIILGTAFAAFVVSSVLGFAASRIPVPASWVSTEYDAVLSNAVATLGDFTVRHRVGAATGALIAALAVAGVAGVTFLFAPVVAAAFVTAIASLTFWGPMLFLTGVTSVTLFTGAMIGAKVQQKSIDTSAKKYVQLEENKDNSSQKSGVLTAVKSVVNPAAKSAWNFIKKPFTKKINYNLVDDDGMGDDKQGTVPVSAAESKKDSIKDTNIATAEQYSIAAAEQYSEVNDSQLQQPNSRSLPPPMLQPIEEDSILDLAEEQPVAGSAQPG